VPANKSVTILILMFAVIGMMSIHAYGQSIPPQMKIIAKMWVDGLISDAEYLKVLQSMVDSGLLKGQKSSASSGTNTVNEQTAKSDTGKLFSLLPQKADLGPEWKIKKSSDYNKATKSFYYENAGQVNYEKDVHTIKEYRMNVFQFSSPKLAQETYDEKYVIVKDNVSYYEKHKKEQLPDKLIMDSQNCVAINLNARYEDLDHMYGYCLVKNYLIYEDITGYYPDMKSDFVRMMDIAKGKVSR